MPPLSSHGPGGSRVCLYTALNALHYAAQLPRKWCRFPLTCTQNSNSSGSPFLSMGCVPVPLAPLVCFSTQGPSLLLPSIILTFGHTADRSQCPIFSKNALFQNCRLSTLFPEVFISSVFWGNLISLSSTIHPCVVYVPILSFPALRTDFVVYDEAHQSGCS